MLRDAPALVRRLRLASGAALFTYLTLHFINHSLGNISWQAMERGAVVAEWIWRGPVGTVLYCTAPSRSTLLWPSGPFLSGAICEWAASRHCGSASAY
jgi:hypothetical protein